LRTWSERLLGAATIEEVFAAGDRGMTALPEPSPPVTRAKVSPIGTALPLR